MNRKTIRSGLKINIPLLLAALIISSFFSCNLKVVSEDYRSFKNAQWPQDTVMVFKFDIPDSTRIYSLFLNVRNEGRYPYSNLYLFISVTPPRGKVLQDTVELTLADIHGKWLGSGLGDLYERQYPYKENIFFPQKGSYTIKVRQGMRTDDQVLRGIHDFGISLKKVR